MDLLSLFSPWFNTRSKVSYFDYQRPSGSNFSGIIETKCIRILSQVVNTIARVSDISLVECSLFSKRDTAEFDSTAWIYFCPNDSSILIHIFILAQDKKFVQPKLIFWLKEIEQKYSYFLSNSTLLVN